MGVGWGKTISFGGIESYVWIFDWVGVGALTLTFKGQLYSEFLLMCKNILTCENIKRKCLFHMCHLHTPMPVYRTKRETQTGVSICSPLILNTCYLPLNTRTTVWQGSKVLSYKLQSIKFQHKWKKSHSHIVLASYWKWVMILFMYHTYFHRTLPE